MKVLLVTTRDSGRWILPKGWIMDGKKPWAAAEIEAMEEAGAKGHIGHDVIGEYRYPKVKSGGVIVPCRVRVYPMIVERLKNNWKEKGQRKRKWFSVKAAAKKVDDPGVAELLGSLIEKPRKQPIIRDLLKAS